MASTLDNSILFSIIIDVKVDNFSEYTYLHPTVVYSTVMVYLVRPNVAVWAFICLQRFTKLVLKSLHLGRD